MSFHAHFDRKGTQDKILDMDSSENSIPTWYSFSFPFLLLLVVAVAVAVDVIFPLGKVVVSTPIDSEYKGTSILLASFLTLFSSSSSSSP